MPNIEQCYSISDIRYSSPAKSLDADDLIFVDEIRSCRRLIEVLL